MTHIRNVNYARICDARVFMLSEHTVNTMPAIARGFILRRYLAIVHDREDRKADDELPR